MNDVSITKNNIDNDDETSIIFEKYTNLILRGAIDFAIYHIATSGINDIEYTEVSMQMCGA